MQIQSGNDASNSYRSTKKAMFFPGVQEEAHGFWYSSIQIVKMNHRLSAKQSEVAQDILFRSVYLFLVFWLCEKCT